MLVVIVSLWLAETTSLGALAQPDTRFGDGWNYLAAGERLNAGHQLYAMSPGDRPVQIVPPYWKVPLLSPPPIAVVWRPLALLGDAAMWIWSAGAIALSAALLLLVVARGGMVSLVGAAALGPVILMTAATGNANGYLGPLLGFAWLYRSRPVAPAAVVVAATAVKLTPASLLPWLFSSRRLAWATVVAVVVIVASAALAPGAWGSWLAAVPDSAPSPFSVAGRLGLSARLVGLVILATGFAAALVMRRRERAVFTIGILSAVLASPVVYFETFALFSPLLVINLPEPQLSVPLPRPPVRETAVEPIGRS